MARAAAWMLAFSLLQPLNAFIRPRLDNGLALTPPMGWNSYNRYTCFPNESIIQSNAKALVDLGLADLGYYYVTTDCGWASKTRTTNDTITWNPALFPSGFPALGDYIHSLGLGFGVYSDSGIYMCGNAEAGSLGNEVADADTFSAWGADMLKYDNCYSDADTGYPNVNYTPDKSPSSRYADMTEALQSTGRDMLFAICEWGVDFPSAWAPALGNTWRLTNDIIPEWRTIYRQVNQFVPSASLAGVGQWPDMDLLEVGNDVFTLPEEQTHFSLWSILKSPLIISAALEDSLTSINADSLAILSNTRVIGYNQDSLGKPANLTKRDTEGGIDMWSGPLSNDRTIVALVNWNDAAINGTLSLPDIGLQSAGVLFDVWNNISTTNVKTSYSATIPEHGTLLVELGETTPVGIYPAAMFAEVSGQGTTFSNVYGLTASTQYPLTINFDSSSSSSILVTVTTSGSSNSANTSLSAGAQSVSLLVTLNPVFDNTITVKLPSELSSPSPSVSSLLLGSPPSTFYPATAFTTAGGASLYTCHSDLCEPVGSKITYLSPNGSAQVAVSSNASSPTSSSNSTTSMVSKWVELTYCNNDVAFDTSWTNGRNARNVTISVNDGLPVRLEVPLAGRSSELFSPGKGWEDSATLGVLVPGFRAAGASDGEVADDVLTVSNAGGNAGVQPLGADIVGVRVWG
ncbi:hypothetical protein MMC10_010771 [Thelotrema lepadinum]|nr:hypothetical protein [Thelotrema lepadinum]